MALSWSSKKASGMEERMRRRLTTASRSTPSERRLSSMPRRSDPSISGEDLTSWTSLCTYLADKRQFRCVGMKRVPDELVHDRWSVVFGRVDVIDAPVDCVSRGQQLKLYRREDRTHLVLSAASPNRSVRPNGPRGVSWRPSSRLPWNVRP